MYIVKDLDKELVFFDGTPIKLPPPKNENITIRKVLVQHMGMFNLRTSTGAEMIKAYNWGIKIHDAKDLVELEDADFQFIRRAIEENPQYSAVIIGQTLKYLDLCKVEKAEETKPELE